MKVTLFVLLVWSLLLGVPAHAAQPKYNEQQLNRAIQEDADDARAWFRLGVLQTHDGRILQAMEAFRQVIRINPNVVEPHHNLAAIYESLDDFDAAAEELKQVIALAPRDVQSQTELAGLYLKMAAGIYRGIARRDPKNRVIKRDHLAQLLCRQSLSKVSGDDAMEQVLQRMVAPSPPSPVMINSFPVPENALPPDMSVTEPKVEGASPAPKQQPHTKKVAVASSPVVHRADVSSHRKRVNSVSPSSDADRKKQVLAAVEAWKKGWESRDAKRYFSFYSDAFVPPKWSLKLWYAHKRNVFRKAKFVRLALKHLQVELLDDLHARVSFDQDYKSDYYQARSRKVVTWVNENGVWKVLRETSIEVH